MKIVFQEIAHLTRAVPVKNDVRVALQVVRCELLRTSSGSMRRLDRVERLRWGPFSVRFAATVETLIARGEDWSLLL